jgi:hypothetical protein
MPAVQRPFFEISSTVIRSRCAEVASAPERYDFPNRILSCEQYFALIRLYSRLNFDRDDDLLAGALAVYGWMPTMLNELKLRDQLKYLINDLNRAAQDQVPSVLERHLETGALRAVNNSIVGTSKLLHFFFPHKVAIWDGVLGLSFGMKHRHQMHREDRFIAYVSAIHEAVETMETPWEALDMAAGGRAETVSKVRKIEFALYAFAQHSARRSLNQANSVT